MIKSKDTLYYHSNTKMCISTFMLSNTLGTNTEIIILYYCILNNIQFGRFFALSLSYSCILSLLWLMTIPQ